MKNLLRKQILLKTLKFLISILTFALIFTGCNNDDETATPNPVNQPPGAFSLLEVEDNGTAINLLPTFTWNTSTDPDGDAVKYDVYLGFDTEPENMVASDLNTATFALTDKLDMVRDYHWKVVAKDGKGGETSSGTFTFKTRPSKVTRVQITKPFEQRSIHTSLIYDDKMWVMGGSLVFSLNDVWASSDGLEWEQIKPNDSNDFPARRVHSSAILLGKMYVIGGLDSQNARLNDVWSSSDGINWIQALTPQDFPGVSNHTTVVFNGKMWHIGGSNASGKTSEVWNTSNGDNWKLVQSSSSAEFAPRINHAVVVFEDKLWIIGGQGGSGQGTFRLNDVWQSEEGADWTRVTENAGFASRYDHEVVVFDNKMWLIGGHNGGNPTNEIWYSKDGVTWIDATPEDSFVPVLGHTSVVFDNKIWVLGGANNPEDNNLVWTIE